MAVSVRYATFPEDGLTPRALVSAADRWLDTCKLNGNARVTTAS
ncbi:MAG TPA: hypothetical protein VEH50_04590 [Methylomirabilota bacterium]|nr:hypothetical protein [Methylomirabilota bacterium]